MCYNAAYSLKKSYERAIKATDDPADKKRLEDELDSLQEQLKKLREMKEYNVRNEVIIPSLTDKHIPEEIWYTNAFDHSPFPVLYSENGQNQFGFFQWGLIPRWCNTALQASQIWNQTINARSETIFEKSSFKASAIDRRCVIFLTGWFEFFHYSKVKYPFFIRSKSESVIAVAGIWDRAVIDEMERFTFSIVTMPANETVAQIHNSKPNDSRMPIILNDEGIKTWLNPEKTIIERLKLDLIELSEMSAKIELDAYPVGQLQGKHGLGNQANAQAHLEYPELSLLFS